ncbi:hypothetical protein PVT01_000027100 [Plasmodium vivax]|uniref:VIR protein n=1 Tax=Plasmodium vivax TaxID=5855 RepID=A0A1G4E963_PLAVI|nr:hypothetical protein PVT01_000027100 [Plasmodium vivax]
MSSSDFCEQFCSFSKIINRFDDEYKLENHNIEHGFESTNNLENEKMKKVSSMLNKNYSTIGSYGENFYAPCCKYLNFWLDSQKEFYVTKTSAISDNAWNHIENLWDKIKQNDTSQCERKINNKPLSEKKKFMDFMIYCINKEELKKKCDRNYTIQRYKEIYCSDFNNYTNKKYEYFLEQFKCLEDTNNDSDYTFNFSNECTLQDMSKTFPEYDITTDRIVYGKKRKTIEQCKNNTIIRDNGDSLANRPASLVDGQVPSTGDQDGLVDDKGGLAGDKGGLA